MALAIRAEHIGKEYKLGLTHQGSIRELVNSMTDWALGRSTRKPTPRGESFWALNDVSFELQHGQVLGVIGRNGAGKSTLLKVLSRITAPTTGQIELRGRVASLLEVGTGFHPELTGRENVFLNGAILGMTRAEVRRKFDEIVAFAEVQDFIDTPVKRYSSGMYTRLAFAVAAHLEPEILIVDEVLAVGDVTFQKKCIGKMQDVSRQGRTVLFVSHNMDAVLNLCSHTLIMKDGRGESVLPVTQGVQLYLQSQKQQGTVALATRARQQSISRAPIFVGLEIWGNDDSLGVIRCGGKFRAKVELRDFADVTEPVVGLIITNQLSQRVVAFQTQMHPCPKLSGANHRILQCDVPALMLTPGSYSVDLAISDGYAMIERVESAGSFEIVYADLFGTGRIPDSRYGLVLAPCQWSIAG